MPPHPLTNFEIQKYYPNELQSVGAYSRKKLPKIENGAYIMNLDEFKSIGTYWIAWYVNCNNIYFDSFGVDHFPKEIKKFIRNKNIITNIYGVQA